MRRSIAPGIVLMFFTACATVSPAPQPAPVPVPVTPTTGTANAPAPAPKPAPVPVPVTPTTGTTNAPVPAPSLTISRMIISAGVMERTPLDMGTAFPASQEKVYCFLEFKDVEKETTVSVVWTLGQKEIDKIPLTIKPYPRYRTWVNKTINGMKGEWKVDVLDDKGNLLKSTNFTIQ